MVTDCRCVQGMMYSETSAVAPPIQTAEHQTAALPDPGAAESSDAYSYGTVLFDWFCGAFINVVS